MSYIKISFCSLDLMTLWTNLMVYYQPQQSSCQVIFSGGWLMLETLIPASQHFIGCEVGTRLSISVKVTEVIEVTLTYTATYFLMFTLQIQGRRRLSHISNKISIQWKTYSRWELSRIQDVLKLYIQRSTNYFLIILYI